LALKAVSYLQIERVELAEKTLKVMKEQDEDKVLTAVC
jgi:hypothetical protein